MRTLAQIISWLSCVGTILPSILFYYGSMDLPQVKTWMLVASCVWFVVTPLWMERKAG